MKLKLAAFGSDPRILQGLSGVSVGMAGDVSYLVATNDTATGESVSAVRADSGCEISLAPGGDRLESMICVFNFGNAPAIVGRTPSVQSGSLCVWADEVAVQDPVEYDSASVILLAGDDPGTVRYASESTGAKCVVVAPFCRVRVPETMPGIASYVVSNTTERIALGETANGTNVFKVVVLDDVTVDFIAAEGCDIVSGGRVVIPSITNDVTIGEGAYPAPDVRRLLSLTLPESQEGESYVVVEGSEPVAGASGEGETAVYPVHSGFDVKIVCTAQKGWRIVSEANVVAVANIQESQVLTAADLPQARRVFTVTVAGVVNAYYDLSTTDARMERAGEDAALILSGSEVTVTFVARDGYRITANGEKKWTLTGDVTFGATPGFPLPTVEAVPGTVAAPWPVGENVVAYTNAMGELTIEGTGVMDDFASAADVPWDPETVTAVTVDERVTRVGVNAFVALADNVLVNGLPASQFRSISPGFMPVSSQPSGAISPAEFERIDIIDGKAYLSVSVYTNSEVKAKGEGWGVATNGVIVVPAPGKQGFFYLRSKPAAPSDYKEPPTTIDVQH